MLIFTAQKPQTQSKFCVCGFFLPCLQPYTLRVVGFDTLSKKTNRYKYRSYQQFFIFLGKNSTPNNK
jgi:hypothetical protein